MRSRVTPTDVATLFSGNRLTLARHLSGLRKSELARSINKSPSAVTGWESGIKRPSASTVAELSLRLGVSPDFFLASAEPADFAVGTPHFRSLRTTSQILRDQASAYGRLITNIAIGLERHVEFPEVNVPIFPCDESSADGPEQAAQALRRSWKLDQSPVKHLLRTAEHHGVIVAFSPPQSAPVDAYSFSSETRPVVILNPMKHDYYRQRFDMAHELGHLIMHLEAEPGGRVIENQAHRFAAELLIPKNQLEPVLPRSMNASAWKRLAELKEQWGVSVQALLYQARSLGTLSNTSYRNAMTTISSRGWRRNEPGQIQALERASLLPKAVELLKAEGFDETFLSDECRTPLHLFRAATSRKPLALNDVSPSDKSDQKKVVSLLPTADLG